MTAPQFTEDPRLVFAAADFANEAGLEGVFCFDHLVPLGDPRRPIFELTSVLGALAAKGGGVGSLVLRAPLRGPVISAAIAATVTAVGPERFVLGLGSGDSRSRDEQRRFGLEGGSLAERITSVESTIERVRSLAPRVPIWVGGTHPQIRRLAVARADGWNGWGIDLRRLGELVGWFRERRPDLTLSWGGAVVAAGDRGELERLLDARRTPPAIAGTYPEVARRLAETFQLGIDVAVVSILPNRPERWRMFHREVLGRLYR
ncbi:MAG: hypothetical protein KatS3mg011_1800 [Acidimicrobiia bacterium]|nr:MAG: hypothetical protein KatS3mg011_1800 [Acidimicrobiia bacterium]